MLYSLLQASRGQPRQTSVLCTFRFPRPQVRTFVDSVIGYGKGCRQSAQNYRIRCTLSFVEITLDDLPPPQCACSTLRPSQSPDFESVLLRHRGDDTVHPQVLYKLPVVVCDVPNGNH